MVIKGSSALAYGSTDYHWELRVSKDYGRCAPITVPYPGRSHELLESEIIK
jgi:hypothetical protein